MEYRGASSLARHFPTLQIGTSAPIHCFGGVITNSWRPRRPRLLKIEPDSREAAQRLARAMRRVDPIAAEVDGYGGPDGMQSLKKLGGAVVLDVVRSEVKRVKGTAWGRR